MLSSEQHDDLCLAFPSKIIDAITLRSKWHNFQISMKNFAMFDYREMVMTKLLPLLTTSHHDAKFSMEIW